LKLAVRQSYRYTDPTIQFQKIREGSGIGSIDRIIAIQYGCAIFALPPSLGMKIQLDITVLNPPQYEHF
jgi:hypothetical protein